MNDNAGPGRHGGEQFVFGIGNIHIHFIVNYVVGGSSAAGNQPHRTFKGLFRIGIYRELNLLAYLDLPDIRFVHQGFDLHLVQVGDGHDDLRRTDTGADGLADRGRFADDIAVNRRIDIGIIGVGNRLLMGSLGNPVVHQGRIILLLRDSAFTQQRRITVHGQRGFIQRSFPLLFRSFQGRIIQPQQQLSGGDVVVFRYQYLYDTTGNLGADIHIIQRAEAAGSRNAFLQVPVFHGNRFYRFRFCGFLALVIFVAPETGSEKNCQKHKGIEIIF